MPRVGKLPAGKSQEALDVPEYELLEGTSLEVLAKEEAALAREKKTALSREKDVLAMIDKLEEKRLEEVRREMQLRRLSIVSTRPRGRPGRGAK